MAETKIHLYDKCEETLNTCTHLFGALLALIGMVFIMLKVSRYQNPVVFFAFFAYSLSNFSVFFVSSMYHGSKKINRKILWQKADHSMVGMVIAGTSTPLLLVLANGKASAIILCFIWLVTLFNAGLNIISVSKFKKQSQLLYLFAIILIAVALLISRPNVSLNFYLLLFSGILVLLIGWIFYFQKSRKYTHVIWHLADIACSVLQFSAFYFFYL